MPPRRRRTTQPPPEPTPPPVPEAPVHPRRQYRRKFTQPAAPVLDKLAAEEPRVVAPTPRPMSRQQREAVGLKSKTEKIRLSSRWSQVVREVKAGMYSWAEFVDGLDDEELARGQLRDKDGTFIGRPPAWVPREFHLAIQRELRRRFESIFSEEVLGIARQYLEMAKNPDLKPETKAKMLQYAMERIFGGIPKEFKVTQEQPWEQMIVNVTSDGSGEMPEHLRQRYDGLRGRVAPGASDDSGEEPSD